MENSFHQPRLIPAAELQGRPALDSSDVSHPSSRAIFVSIPGAQRAPWAQDPSSCTWLPELTCADKEEVGQRDGTALCKPCPTAAPMLAEGLLKMPAGVSFPSPRQLELFVPNFARRNCYQNSGLRARGGCYEQT